MSDDELVVMAEKLISRFKDKLRQQSSEGRTQLSKAIEVAKASGSFPVFINWVRYQMARERTSGGAASEIWRVIGEAICATAAQIQRSGSDPQASISSLIKFLGYLRRAFIGINYMDRIPALGGEG
ncbi:TPA: hypothetical protein EYP37_03635 [Candidatus Poribacteria bacterium]|nr:hypothetical protein [Candidatus Poribacteria bacterium]